MVVARSNGADATQPADCRWRLAASLRPVPKLTVAIAPPASDAMRTQHSTRVCPTRGEREGARECPHGDRRSRMRARIAPRAVAQLTIIVPTPAPDGTISLQRAGVLAPHSDGADASQPADRHRRQAVGHRAVAQLAAIVLPPAPDATVVQQRAGMVVARSNGSDAAQPADRHRRQAARRRAITQLAAIILPPTAHPASHHQHTGMLTARRDADPADRHRRPRRHPLHRIGGGCGGHRWRHEASATGHDADGDEQREGDAARVVAHWYGLVL